LGRHFIGQADYTDYNECEMEIAKSVGFNSPQLAAVGWNLSFIDTPWLAAGKFIPIL